MAAATDWAEEVWHFLKPQTRFVSTFPVPSTLLVIDGSLHDGANRRRRTPLRTCDRPGRGLIKNGNARDGYSVIYLGGTPLTIVPARPTLTTRFSKN